MTQDLSEMVIKSLKKKCSISNAMDGSEDNELFSDVIKSRDVPDCDAGACPPDPEME